MSTTIAPMMPTKMLYRLNPATPWPPNLGRYNTADNANNDVEKEARAAPVDDLTGDKPSDKP
jgi:hypothetical protein